MPTRDCKEALVNDIKSLGKNNPGLCLEVALSQPFFLLASSFPLFFSPDSHHTFGCSTTLFISRFLFANLSRVIKQRALVTVRKNFLLFIPKFATFLLFGSRFCFSFNPRTFVFRKPFQVHKTISIATRTTTLECKQKMLK